MEHSTKLKQDHFWTPAEHGLSLVFGIFWELKASGEKKSSGLINYKMLITRSSMKKSRLAGEGLGLRDTGLPS